MKRQRQTGIGERRRRLEAFGRTPDRPSLMIPFETPMGIGEASSVGRQIGVGVTPKERLSWVLDNLVYASLDALSHPARVGLFRVCEDLVVIVTRHRWFVERVAPEVVEVVTRRSPLASRRKLSAIHRGAIERWPQRVPAAYLTRPGDPTRALVSAQTAVREALETIAGGAFYMRGEGLKSEDHPGQVIRPFAAPTAVTLVISRDSRFGLHVHESIGAALSDAAVSMTITLLAEVGIDALGRCQYTNGQECGRVFLRRGRQKWCSEHRRVVRSQQLKKAFEAYKKRQKRIRQKRGSR